MPALQRGVVLMFTRCLVVPSENGILHASSLQAVAIKLKTLKISGLTAMNRNYITTLGLQLSFWLLLLLKATELEARTGNQDSDSSAFIDRWSFRTNAVEWIATVPNIGLEFDLGSSEYNKLSLALSARYNWDTYHNYSPSTVFNLLEVRPELRRYWRVSSDKRPKAKTNRAYYAGIYLHGGTYSVKFTETGRQGNFFGLGVSLGYGIPLYNFKRNYLDLELGLAIGMIATKYDVFTHHPIGNYYTQQDSRSLHVVPYPLVTEIKAAFVFRTKSIKDKFDKTRPKNTLEPKQKDTAKKARKEKRDKKDKENGEGE